MKGKPKLYIIFKLSVKNVDIKAKRPTKMNKIAHISVCIIHRIDLIKIQ